MIENFDNYLRDVIRRLSTKNISVDRDWLSGCVEYFLSEDPQISNDQMYKQAYNQWLLSDLCEFGEKCLPNTVTDNKNEFTLNGKFPLQMQYLIDIAESAYDQLRNLYNQKLDEPDEEQTEQRRPNVSKKKRMLKLELTDGHSIVIAMECTPVPCLNTKLAPGIKMLLKGPMRCVNKVLFLEPENVEILGGEVGKLEIENAFENVLLKALGRPINPTPKLEYQEPVVQLNQPRTNITHVPQVAPVTFHNPTTTSNIINDDDDDLFSTIDMDALNQNIVPNRSSTTQHLFDDDDDDIFFDANIPGDLAVTNQTTEQNNRQTSSYNPIGFDDDSLDMIDMTEVENDVQNELLEEEERNNHFVQQPPVRAVQNNLEYFDPELDALFAKDDGFQYSNRITDDNYEYKISGCPLVTIVQLNAANANDKNGKSFLIKCEVDSIHNTLRIRSNNQWTLGVCLKDSSNDTLKVQMSNDVIAGLADTTAEEMQKMRSALKDRPQLREEMTKICENLKEKVENLFCFMKVNFCENILPEIVELLEYQRKDEEIFEEKMVKERNLR